MTLIRRSLIRKVVLLLAPVAAFFMSPAVPAQKRIEDSRRVTFQYRDDDLKRRLEIRGKVEFNDEYTDIKDVSAGGFVHVEEVKDGLSRRYEVRGYADGKVVRMFYVNGQMREMDAAARAWVAQLVLDAAALRDTLAHAGRHISSDYEQAQLLIGVAPVLEGKDLAIPAFFTAVNTIKSDYERGRVLSALLKNKQIG